MLSLTHPSTTIRLPFPPTIKSMHPRSYTYTKGDVLCFLCDSALHHTHGCTLYSTWAQRRAIFHQRGLCTLCSLPGHTKRRCRKIHQEGKGACTTCGGLHHPVLCFEGFDNKSGQQVKAEREEYVSQWDNNKATVVCSLPLEEKEKMIPFFTKVSPFSNHHPCHFKINGCSFNCSEQFYMWSKAAFFGDTTRATQIMSTADPGQQKRLGKQVHGFDQQHWDKVKWHYMVKACTAKFTQNQHLRLQLFQTRGTTLVEASPYDKCWGVGLAATNPKILDRKLWPGQNWMGLLLTKLREELLRKPLYMKEAKGLPSLASFS